MILIGAAALWFRISGLTDNPFWLDEAYSAYAADKGFGFIFNVLPSYETHPPFYSALLSAWTMIAGNSLLGFRTLSFVISVAMLPLFWLAGKESGRAVGLNPQHSAFAALALTAMLPPIIYITQLVRPYAAMAFVYLLGIWAVFRLARSLKEDGTPMRAAWLTYFACLALLVWLHNLGALYAAALGLAMLIMVGPLKLWRDHRSMLLIGHAVVASVVLPAFLILLDQAPTWKQSTWLRFHWDGIDQSLSDIYGIAGFGAFVCVCAIIGVAIIKTQRKAAPAWIALATLAFLPAILSLILTLTIAPVFLARTLVPASVAFALLVATSAAVPMLISRAAFAALIVLTTMQMVALQSLGPTQNWYGAVAWLQARVKAGDVIYAYPNEGALPLSYALRDKGQAYPIRAIPQPVPANDPTGWHPTGNRGVVSLPQYRLDAIAADPASRKVKTIWLLRLGAKTYDKDDGFVKALLKTRQRVGHWHDDPIDIIGLRQTPETSPQVAPPKQAQP